MKFKHNFILLKIVALLMLQLLIPSKGRGQYFSIGNNPASVKWRYIESSNFKVIYPNGLDSMANRYSWLLEEIRPFIFRTREPQLPKLDVVLHPFNAQSNGLVGWAPSRMELITMPPINSNYIFNWEKHLVTHELRHVAQISQFRKGIFKIGHLFIGEQSETFGMGLFMGRWSLEGDAVIGETEMGIGGRGRDPSHLLYFRTAFLEGEQRRYDSWALGSYKNYTPDHYSFGYLLSSYMRYKSISPALFEEVNDYSIRHFYNPFAQKKAFRRLTSLTKRQNFAELTSYYTTRWREEQQKRPLPTPATPIIESKKGGKDSFLLHHYPISKGDTLLFVRSGLSEIPALFSKSNGGESEFLKYLGRINSPLKLGGERIFWSEYIKSARWELQQYSDIHYYDISTKKVKRATVGKYFFNPSPSASGDSLLVISQSVEGGSGLHLLDREFNQIAYYNPPKGWRLKEGVIVNGGVVVLAISDLSQALFYRPFEGGEWNQIEEFAAGSLSKIDYSPLEREILFLADFEGVRALYSLSLTGGKLFNRVMPKYGLHSYSLNESGVVVSDFSLEGYWLKMVGKERVQRREMAIDSLKKGGLLKDPIVEKLVADTRFNSDSLVVPENLNLQSHPYRKECNLIRVHSWAPLYINIDNIKRMSYETLWDLASPGVMLFSQNSLSSAVGSLGYAYRNGFNSLHFNFKYTGLYPVIEFSSSINEREPIRYNILHPTPESTQLIEEPRSGASYFKSALLLYIPLRYNRGGWNWGIIPSLQWSYSNDSFYSHNSGKFLNYQQLYSRVSLYRILRMSYRDLYPKWGGGFTLELSTAPFSEGNLGSFFNLSSYFYLPGAKLDHGVRLSVNYQRQLSNNREYMLQNSFPFPMGYSGLYSSSAVGGELKYGMPLFTKELTIPSILHIKRGKLFPFVQYTQNVGRGGLKRSLWAAGCDLLFDLNLLGISHSFEFGVRSGYNGESETIFELLLNLPL
ncbi:MAG: hypothetical protein WC960_00590 [Bacteroidales bacterium]